MGPESTSSRRTAPVLIAAALSLALVGVAVQLGAPDGARNCTATPTSASDNAAAISTGAVRRLEVDSGPIVPPGCGAVASAAAARLSEHLF